LLAPFLAAVREGCASGEFVLADPDRDVAIIVPLCGGVLRELLDGTSALSVDDAIANTQRFVLRGLGARGT
jgi:hypothetical protein